VDYEKSFWPKQLAMTVACGGPFQIDDGTRTISKQIRNAGKYFFHRLDRRRQFKNIRENPREMQQARSP
jgi:hypothetical protein